MPSPDGNLRDTECKTKREAPATLTCSHTHEKKAFSKKVQGLFTLRATAWTAGPRS
jgi:hypothetical protein